MHTEATPFEDLYSAWDGTPSPEPVLGALKARLERN
jgi:hypothetical protein